MPRPLLLALQFLTVLPLRRQPDYQPQDLARARAWFGLVGLCVGLVLGGAAWLLTLRLGPLAAAGPLLLLWESLSRFLHLDAVADTADALVHTTERERALAIMKDSRIGAFGLGAVVLMMLTKFGALAGLPPARLIPALIIAPALGRALAAGLSALLPPARAGAGLGAQCAGPESTAPVDGGALLGSAGVAVAAAFLAGGVAGLWAVLAVLLLGLALARWYMARIQGVTGDCLGAAIESGEALALLVMAAF